MTASTMEKLRVRNLKRLSVCSALISTGAALAGCTSILGDYDVSNAGAPGEGGLPDTGVGHPDGGPGDGGILEDGVVPDSTVPPADGGPGDGGGGFDGGADAGPYGCAFKFKGNPIVVDTYGGPQPGGGGGSAVLATGPQVVSVGPNLARIVVRKPQSTAFTVYTVDKSGRTVTPVNSSVTEVPLAAHGVSGGVGVLTSRMKTTGILGGTTPGGVVGTTPSLTLFLYTLLDSSGAQAVLGSPLQLMADTATGGGVVQGGNFTSLLAANDYAFALAAGTGGTFALLDGRSSGGSAAAAQTVATGGSAFAGPSILRDAVLDRLLVYTKSGPDGKGSVVYTVSGTGAPSKMAAPRSLSGPGTLALLLDTGGTALGGGYDHAFLVTTGGGLGQGGTVRIGQVAQAALDTFRADDLAEGPTLGPTEIPADKGVAQFFGEEFAAIGRGTKADGLNFVWLGIDGTVHAKEVGPTALLAGRPSPPVFSAISLAQRTKNVGTWNVVWSETTTPANGSGQAYDTLYLDELVCQ